VNFLRNPQTKSRALAEGERLIKQGRCNGARKNYHVLIRQLPNGKLASRARQAMPLGIAAISGSAINSLCDS
jgi:hypothetical protein